jgi:hypothetical protein
MVFSRSKLMLRWYFKEDNAPSYFLLPINAVRCYDLTNCHPKHNNVSLPLESLNVKFHTDVKLSYQIC